MKLYHLLVKQWIDWGLKNKLIVLFILSALLPTLLLSTYVYRYSHQRLVETEYKTVHSGIQLAIDQIDRLFSDIESDMREILFLPQVSDALTTYAVSPSFEWFSHIQQVEASLKTISANSVYPVGASIIGCNGTNYMGDDQSNRFETIHSPVAQQVVAQPYNTAILGRKNFHGTQVVTLGKSIKRSNKLVGVLLMDTPASVVSSYFSALDAQNIHISAYDRSGQLFFQVGEQLLSEPIHQAITSTAPYGDSLVTINREEYLCITQEGSSYILQALVPTAYIYADSRIYLTHGLVLAVWIVIQTLLYSYIISGMLTARLRRLTNEVNRFAQTMQVIDVDCPPRDEIGQLVAGTAQMSRQIVVLIHQVKEDEHNKRELELKALRSQFNPHLLYNTLNTITYLAKIQGVDNIQEVSKAFSRFMRAISRSDTELITLRQELSFTSDYLTIKKYNLISDLQLTINASEEVLDKPVMKLLLQPFIENAIVHGFRQCIGHAKITIDVELQGDYLNIKITDNGCGIPPQTLEKILKEMRQEVSDRVGIRNTVQRFFLIYHDNCYFNMDSQLDRFTTVELAFPYLEV